uniref:Uncharacterized protein n=1 Tax=viral metagenome TaxID=1070528 RepID=A0A6M3JE44_9ZZZZ
MIKIGSTIPVIFKNSVATAMVFEKLPPTVQYSTLKALNDIKCNKYMHLHFTGE